MCSNFYSPILLSRPGNSSGSRPDDKDDEVDCEVEDEGGGELEGYKERDDEGRTTREGRRRRKTPPPKGLVLR